MIGDLLCRLGIHRYVRADLRMGGGHYCARCMWHERHLVNVEDRLWFRCVLAFVVTIVVVVVLELGFGI